MSAFPTNNTAVHSCTVLVRLQMAGDILIMLSASSTFFASLLSSLRESVDLLLAFTSVRIYVISPEWSKRKLVCMLVLGLACPALSAVRAFIDCIVVYLICV